MLILHLKNKTEKKKQKKNIQRFKKKKNWRINIFNYKKKQLLKKILF